MMSLKGASVAVVDDRVLQRILRGEMHRMNRGTVTDPVPLGPLLSAEAPSATRKDGGRHGFDREALSRLWRALSPLARARLRVPVRVFVPHDLTGDCYVADPDCFDALHQLGGVSRPPREGRLWMALPIAQDLARAYPTCVEFLRQ